MLSTRNLSIQSAGRTIALLLIHLANNILAHDQLRITKTDNFRSGSTILCHFSPTIDKICLAYNRFHSKTLLFRISNENQEHVSCMWKCLTSYRSTEANEIVTKWSQIIKPSVNKNMNIFKIVSYVLSIPGTSAYGERVFSVMSSKWRDERNRCSVDLIKRAFYIFQFREHMSRIFREDQTRFCAT